MSVFSAEFFAITGLLLGYGTTEGVICVRIGLLICASGICFHLFDLWVKQARKWKDLANEKAYGTKNVVAISTAKELEVMHLELARLPDGEDFEIMRMLYDLDRDWCISGHIQVYHGGDGIDGASQLKGKNGQVTLQIRQLSGGEIVFLIPQSIMEEIFWSYYFIRNPSIKGGALTYPRVIFSPAEHVELVQIEFSSTDKVRVCIIPNGARVISVGRNGLKVQQDGSTCTLALNPRLVKSERFRNYISTHILNHKRYESVNKAELPMAKK